VLAVGLAAPLAPIASADDNCNPLVTVYQDVDLKGPSWKYCSTGAIEAYGGARGLPNDTISSIEVSHYAEVYLYEHAGSGGRSLGPLNDRSDMTHGAIQGRTYYNLTDFGFNDMVSSLEITTGNGFVKLYRDVNPGATTSPLVTVINATIAETVPAAINDQISAVYVPWGKILTVYEHANRQGASRSFYAGLHNLTMHTRDIGLDNPSYPSWSDAISSYKVTDSNYLF
jgi:hypothetical protein